MSIKKTIERVISEYYNKKCLMSSIITTNRWYSYHIVYETGFIFTKEVQVADVFGDDKGYVITVDDEELAKKLQSLGHTTKLGSF